VGPIGLNSRRCSPVGQPGPEVIHVWVEILGKAEVALVGGQVREPCEHRLPVRIAGQRVEWQRFVSRGAVFRLAKRGRDLLASQLVPGDLDCPAGYAVGV
jgi:hypothetical protein